VFGWAKTVGGLRKTCFVGLMKVKAQTVFTLYGLQPGADEQFVRVAVVDRLGRGPSGDRRKAGKNPG